MQHSSVVCWAPRGGPDLIKQVLYIRKWKIRNRCGSAQTILNEKQKSIEYRLGEGGITNNVYRSNRMRKKDLCMINEE